MKFTSHSCYTPNLIKAQRVRVRYTLTYISLVQSVANPSLKKIKKKKKKNQIKSNQIDIHMMNF